MSVEDLSLYFGELASDATITIGTSTSSAKVYLDLPTQTALGGIAAIDDPSIVAPATLGLARGATVRIGSTTYTVATVEKLDDGALVRCVVNP